MITIPQTKLIVLDTNVIVHLERGKEVGLAIETAYGLKARTERPLFSSVAEGELLKLTERWNWGEGKKASLATSLNQLVRVSAGESDVVVAYGRIAAHQEYIGKKIGENDTWIAATAQVVGAVVLTCDTDFLNLDQSTVDVAFFDQKTLQPGQ